MRPLTSKRAAEVAYQLMDIYLLLGAPQILHSDNGSVFTASVITELKLLWPDLLMDHDKSRHPQSQGSVERLNCDVMGILTAWLWDNNSTNWPMGLRFVQFQKNSSYHSGIKQSPYKALFGTEVKVGLRSNTYPTEILKRMVSEDDLIAAYTSLPEEQETADTEDVPDAQLRTIQHKIRVQQKRAADGQLVQAECIVLRNRLEHVLVNPGDNVIIPIPFVDRRKGDPRNIIGVIVDRHENILYRVAVRAGVLIAETYSICAPISCIVLRTYLETVRLAYVRLCRVSPSAVVRAMPNATVQPVAKNVGQTDENLFVFCFLFLFFF